MRNEGGWQRSTECVCQMEGRERLSGFPGLHSDTCVDVKDETDSSWLGFLSPRAKDNGNAAMAGIPNIWGGMPE